MTVPESAISLALLELREVERADRLGDQLAIPVGVELLADHDRRRREREVGDLRPNLVERPHRLRGDLTPRVLEPALPLGLGLLAHALLHRLPRVPRLGEDLLGLAARLLHQRPVLFEELAGLGARVLGLLDRAANLLAPL